MATTFSSHHHQLASDRQQDYLARADRARQRRQARRPAAPAAGAVPAHQTVARVPLRVVPPLERRPWAA